MTEDCIDSCSGVNSFIMNYLRSADRSKLDIDVLVYYKSRDGASDPEAVVKNAGGEVFLLPGIKRYPEHITAVRRILRRGEYDIIHDNTLLMTLPLMLESKRQGVKIRLLHSHASKLGETGFKERRNRLLLPALIGCCNHFAACSDAAGKAMFGKRKYDIIPNVIDPREYAYTGTLRETVRKRERVQDKTVVLTVGRVCGPKNPFFALRVIKELSKKRGDIVYWWAGSGPLLGQMKEEAEELGISDRVVLLGTRPDVAGLYAAADVFFLPSVAEGLPIVGIEAQAMGLPSVISGAVTRELVYTDLIRYVPLDAPVSDWTEALSESIGRIPERRPYTAELRGSVFSSESAGERLAGYYQRLIRENGP